MSTVRALTGSTVGRKVLMAVSGGLLVLFVIGHMIGNLKAFQGAEAFNHYAEFLREVGYPLVPHMGLLWIFRIGLLVVVGTHLWCAWTLSRESRAARGGRYKVQHPQVLGYASRTMRWGGVIVFAFIVYHLLHMTVGTVHPDFVAGDAHGNLVRGLGVPWVAASYGIAVTALCLHLQHGIWSALQTVGVSNPGFNVVRRPIASAIAGVVWLGYLSIPVSVLLGVIR